MSQNNDAAIYKSAFYIFNATFTRYPVNGTSWKRVSLEKGVRYHYQESRTK
jgi:hypothetical protein